MMGLLLGSLVCHTDNYVCETSEEVKGIRKESGKVNNIEMLVVLSERLYKQSLNLYISVTYRHKL